MQSRTHLSCNRQLRVKRLSAVDQTVIGQGLNRALVARPGINQHVAPAQSGDRPPRVVAIAQGGTLRPAAEPTVAPQIESPQLGVLGRPALGVAPIVWNVMRGVLDPGSWRIEYRRRFH